MLCYLKSIRIPVFNSLKFSYSNNRILKMQNTNPIHHSTQSKLSQEQKASKFIILGGGCFWCIDGVFRRVKGVVNVRSGYAAGSTLNPNYEQVKKGTTGHAEVCKIFYRDSTYPDQSKETINLKDLFGIFFTVHDPTTLNYQGYDEGTQYRSIILYGNEEEKKLAEQTIKQFNEAKVYNNPIVTEVKPFAGNHFYEAEGYHQRYFDLNQDKNPYCKVVFPKLDKLKKKFSQFYRSNPVE